MNIYTMGIDVGGTKIAYGLFDSDKNLIKKLKTPSDKTKNSEAFFDGICETIHNMLETEGIKKSQLQGIGIGVPSYVLFDEGKIIKTANLTNIRDFPARSYLMNKMGNVPIIIDNDANTGALAEFHHGAGRGCKHMLYCPVSTGISTGIIINEQLFRGSYGWAGESGHMIVTPGFGIEACGCGSKGCLMSYCSGSMIVKHVQKKIAEGSPTVMIELAGGSDQITTAHILNAYDQGDAMALWAVEQMALYLGVWIYNQYALLNINCFVFGGGLLHFGDRLFKRVRRVFDAYNQNDLPVYFKTAELGEDFGIIGANELLSERAC